MRHLDQCKTYLIKVLEWNDIKFPLSDERCMSWISFIVFSVS